MPRRLPRALACASAALVRAEIISRSCSATAARMWMVNRVAWGLSHATKSTPDSIKLEIKKTLRASRSSLAMIKVARRRRQAASATAICGRSLRLPDSISWNSATMMPCAPATWRETASRCASRPSPEAPCWLVDTR